MMKLILLIDGTCVIIKDKKQLYKGPIAGAYAEMVWQGVLPEEVATAFQWFIEKGHDLAYFGLNKTCIYTTQLVAKKQRNIA